MNFIHIPGPDASFTAFAPGRGPVRSQSKASSVQNEFLPYVRVALTQGTPWWLEWRNLGIGASDAPTVMGENPFKSADALLVEKLSPVRAATLNHRMAMGIALEPEARDHYSRAADVVLEPACVQSTRYPWLRASLDGLSLDGSRVVEIKCGRAAYWRTVAAGRPPGYYYGQLQHILAITGLAAIDFVCHFPPALPICVTVARDESYIERLMSTEKRFWMRLVELREKVGPRNARKPDLNCSGETVAA
jgi:putative phage-type endonuclease